MSNQNNLKISHVFNLPNLNFKTQMNIAIDSNAHIKNIINAECYMFDSSLDTVTGKCNVKGKIGVKILYLDVDNVYNTITDEISFTEFVTDNNITSDCKINMYNEQISSEIDFDEKYLKINLNVHARLYSNIDIGINLPDTSNDGLIVKNKQTQTNVCVDKIDNNISDDCTITIPNRASKILSVQISPTLEKIECNSGYLTITGTSLVQTIYELDKESFNEIKLHSETKAFKFETQATLTEPDCNANIILKVNNNKTIFSTELDENQTTIKLDYEMKVCGFVFKNVNLELTEDVYSTANEIETSYTDRELCKLYPLLSYKSTIEGDINLIDNTADEILESVNYSCLITQNYVDNGNVVIEGIICSTLIYLNEQKEIKSMQVELPFSVAKEIENTENCEPINFDVKILNCKAKIKRGNSISLEYDTLIEGYFICKYQSKLLNSIKYGKTYDYGDIAFQIIVAKPNENIWDFCKRAHVSLNKLEETNKEIPSVFNGGEKIIIYR